MYDAYDPCPCGSGKKFKWCCQAIYPTIQKAFALNANRQHDAAIQVLQDLTKHHGHNAEVWGRLAQLLSMNDRMDEAEMALDKALQANYRYAYGYFLRGTFRHEEGELGGALLLYRKALDLAEPEQATLIADIAMVTFECESARHRTLAAEAALTLAERLLPHHERIGTIRAEWQQEQRGLPEFVRRDQKLMPPPALGREEKIRWQQAANMAQIGKFAQAAAAFGAMVETPGAAPTVHFNVGLCRAWGGDYRGALEALSTYVHNEPDENRAAEAWMLAESLRFSEGMEEVSDYLQHSVHYPLGDPQRILQWLSKHPRVGDPKQKEHMVFGTFLDRESIPWRDDIALFELPRIIAFWVISPKEFLVSSTQLTHLAQIRREIETELGSALGQPRTGKKASIMQQFLSNLIDVRVPQACSDTKFASLVRMLLEQKFGGNWLGTPLVSLDRCSPAEAVKRSGGRKKVLGLIRFLEELTKRFVSGPSIFDPVRAQLGLPTVDPAFKLDTALGGSVGVPSDADSDVSLLARFQTAVQNAQNDLAADLAKELTSRPGVEGSADRFPVFRYLIERAITGEMFDKALELVGAGERFDRDCCGSNRASEYAILRARVLFAKADPNAACATIESAFLVPKANLEHIGRAVEMLLRQKANDLAGRLAEHGLKEAQAAGDRDREAYFRELQAASRHS